MSKPARDPLVDLELHRQQLQRNVQELLKNLRHWQTFEAEYEGLREEILTLPPHSSFQDLSRVVNDFDSDLITAKETQELLSPGNGCERRSEQVVDLLSRRIDYVQRNIANIKNQIEIAESKIEGVDIVRKPETRNEEGLPMTDIYEELDDDGNVIASRISRPDRESPQILEALKNAGVNQNGSSNPSSSVPSTHARDMTRQPESLDSTSADSTLASSLLNKQTNKGEESPPLATSDQKSASFAKLSEVVNLPSPPDGTKSLRTTENNTASDLARGSFAGGEKVLELDENDVVVSSFTNPKVPDTPEEAALRRQMQAYSMAEVGNIVARLDLEEDPSDEFSSDEDYESNGEDEYGMSHGGQLSHEYMQQMRELEQKLDARVIQNIGPDISISGDEQAASDARRLVVQPEKTPQPALGNTTSRNTGEKSVRFAEELDVAPTLALHQPPDQFASQDDTKSRLPAAKSVAERVAPGETIEPQSRKVSRFKQAKQQARNTPSADVMDSYSSEQPDPLMASPVADTIVERSSRSKQHPPSEFDPQVVRQQLNSEYYRQRNHLIQRQGGFKRDKLEDSCETDDPDRADEVSNPTKKVSLFKAARVQADKAW